MLRLKAIECVIPVERPTLFELSGRYRVPPAELMVFHRIYGLDRVPVCREPIGDFVEAAVAKMLDQSGVDRSEVRWLVHTHTGSQLNRVGEAMLHRVCQRLGLDRAQPFGMTSNNCASTISALQVVQRLLDRDQPEAKAILVTADIAFTPILQVIPNSSVTGDAAVACLLGRRGAGHRVLASRVDIYGQHAGCQWQEESAAAEFETEYPRRVTRTMEAALAEAGLGWSDVRWIVPHNVNVYSWRSVARCAGIPLDRVYLNQVPKIAHCFGADIFLNLALADQERRFEVGDRLLLVTVGLGAVFGAAVVEYSGVEVPA